MPSLFTLAHLSDVHLGPVRLAAALRNFELKRYIGYSSWRMQRRKLHDPIIADITLQDIKEAAPDHIAFTGDMVNLAAWAEFPLAAQWMAKLGSPEEMSFVPGNHDCYVTCPWEHCLGHFAPWMTSDLHVKQAQTNDWIAAPFPFVRLRKNVALIGLSSARPQPLHRAGGELGAVQLEALSTVLRDLQERSYARVVLIHHPPLPGLASWRKALEDAAALRDVLVKEGAELVLHGHNHYHMVHALTTSSGVCHAVGVPSASVRPAFGYPPASWYLYRIEREDGHWKTAVTVRSFDPKSERMGTASEFTLST
ncbi:MAG TPA: metallophosphoesterase [Aestuariivirga sp.]|nr:metallophosphoesterase [Aestuariivirga sp.]